MYLVSPDYLDTTSTQHSPFPPSKTTRKTPGAEKKRYSKTKRPVQNKKTKKKDTLKDAYDKWVKIHAQLHEADVERDR
jgi:division protein CdvB (Snf7/Vps24/ESCRT-III family)